MFTSLSDAAISRCSYRNVPAACLLLPYRNKFNLLLDEGQLQESKSNSSNTKAAIKAPAKGSRAHANGKAAAGTPAAASKAAPAGSGAAPGRSADGKPVCYKCGSKGHTGDRCKQPYCERCEQFRHVAGECSRACRKCGSLDHRLDGGMPCKNYQCKECGLFGHVYAECPNIVCNTCMEYGHLSRDCPTRAKPKQDLSNMSSTAAAAVAAQQAKLQQQQAAAAAAAAQARLQAPNPQPQPQAPSQAQQQQLLQSTQQFEQRRLYVMDLLLSQAEAYAMSVVGDDQKVALLAQLSDAELHAALSSTDTQQALDAAVAARVQQQQAAAATAAAGAAVAPPKQLGAALKPAAAKAMDPPPPMTQDMLARSMVCGRCGDKGHNKDHCSTPYCEVCKVFRHVTGIQCKQCCTSCGGLDHKLGVGLPLCKSYKCRECGLYGHVYAECPNIVCNLCKQVGHKALDCPSIACHVCGQKGHKARDCTACTRCGQHGHKAKECQGSRAEVRCVHCGEWGHMASRCPGPAAAAALGAAATTPAASWDAAGEEPVTEPANVPGLAAGMQRAGRQAAAAVASDQPAAPKPRVVGAGGAGAWAAAVAGVRVVTPSNVRLLPVPEGMAAEEQRRQKLVNSLMARLEGFAMSVVGNEERLAALSRIVDEDLRALLNTPTPEQHLEAAIKHVIDRSQHEALGAGAAEEAVHKRPPPPPPLQQPQANGTEQLEGELSPSTCLGRGEGIKPGELLQQHAAALEKEFPGYFPPDWQQYSSWRQLEERMHFPEPANRHRAQYRQRRQYFQAQTAAAAMAARTQQQQPPAASVVQQQSSASAGQGLQRPLFAAVAAGASASAAPPAGPLAAEPRNFDFTSSALPPGAGPGVVGEAVPYSSDGPAPALMTRDAPAARGAPASAAPGAGKPSSSEVRLLPAGSLSEGEQCDRFSKVLDLLLPTYESFVTSLGEEQWHVLARIHYDDLAALLSGQQPLQQLQTLLADVTRRDLQAAAEAQHDEHEQGLQEQRPEQRLHQQHIHHFDEQHSQLQQNLQAGLQKQRQQYNQPQAAALEAHNLPGGAQLPQQPMNDAGPHQLQPFMQMHGAMAPTTQLPVSQLQTQTQQQPQSVPRLPPQLQPGRLQVPHDLASSTSAAQAPLATQPPMTFHLQEGLAQQRVPLQQQQQSPGILPRHHPAAQIPMHMQTQGNPYQQQQLFAGSHVPTAAGPGLGLSQGLGLGLGQFHLGLGHLGNTAAGNSPAAAAVPSAGMAGLPPVSMGAAGLGMQQLIRGPGAPGHAAQQYGQPGMLPGQQGSLPNHHYQYGRRSSAAENFEAGQEQDMEHMIKFLGM